MEEEQIRILHESHISGPFAKVKIIEKGDERYYSIEEEPLNNLEANILNKIIELGTYSKQTGINKYINKKIDFRKFFYKKNTENELKNIILKVINDEKINLKEVQFEKIHYYCKKIIAGFGELDPIMDDKNVIGIEYINADDCFYIMHKHYGTIKCQNLDINIEELNKIIQSIALKLNIILNSNFNWRIVHFNNFEIELQIPNERKKEYKIKIIKQRT